MTTIMDCYLAQQKCGSRGNYNYEDSPCGSQLLIVEYDEHDPAMGSSVMDCVVCSANSEDQKDFYEDILDKLRCLICEAKVPITEGEFRDIAYFRDGLERFSCNECSKWKLIQDAENDELIDGDSFDKKLFFFYDGNFFEGKKFENGFLGSNMSFFITEKNIKNDGYSWNINLNSTPADIDKFTDTAEIGDEHFNIYRIR